MGAVMTTDPSTDTPSSAPPRFQPLDADTLRAIFEALVVPGRSGAAIATDVGASKSTVHTYRNRWLDEGLLLRLRGGGVAVNPDKENPFGVTGPAADPESVLPVNGSDAGDETAGESDEDGAERPPEPADTAEDSVSVVEPDGGGDTPPAPAPEPAGGGDDAEIGGGGGGGGGRSPNGGGGEPEWPLPDDRPSGPVTVDGGTTAPAASGLIDPTVVEVQIQIPVTVLAAWNLMRLDGLDLPLNDWVVQTLEYHYQNCLGIAVALVKTRGDDGAPGGTTSAT
jgi:hypothetical protein